MTTGNTTLLGLALPVEGELDGTWGDVVNDSITSLVDSAVAGTTTLSADADVTLTTTVLAANQARQAVLLWTASNGATTRNITAPAQSKPYIVINAGTGSIVLRGAGPTTGVTIVSGEKCLAAWNGSDFVKIATSATGGVTSVGGTGTVNGITLTGTVTSTGNLTLGGALSGVSLTTQVTGTLPVANGGTGVTASTGSGNNVLSTSPTLVTPVLGTPSSVTLTNATGLPLSTGVTGTLPVANGGTGTTSLTANNVILGNGTSAVQVVAPGTSGNVLTSNGTTWQSTALVAGDVTLNGVQTLTNKTISVDSNTLSGIAASSFVLSNASGNIDGTAAQKAIPTGLVVGDSDAQTLTNKTLTSPVIGTIVNTGTLTLPTSTDTLVGRATTDTLTNKTISADNNTLSGIAASSFVLSNASGNIDGAAAQKAIPSGVVVGTTDTQTLTSKTIEAGTFTNGYTEETVTANTSTAYTIDLANGSLQILTLTGNCTFTFPTATAGKGFTLLLKQDATGSRTVTWPASVKWPASTAPTITSTASKGDKYVFVGDGTYWWGSNAGQNYL